MFLWLVRTAVSADSAPGTLLTQGAHRFLVTASILFVFPASSPQIAQTRGIETQLQNKKINSIIKIRTALRTGVDVIYSVRIGFTKTFHLSWFIKDELLIRIKLGWGGENGEWLFNGYRVSVWCENILEIDSGNGCKAFLINATEL